MQTPYDDSGWDVLQEVADNGFSALIFGFRSEAGSERLIVRPRGLLPGAMYDVCSLDAGPIGAARGDAIMQDGIELMAASPARAHDLGQQGTIAANNGSGFRLAPGVTALGLRSFHLSTIRFSSLIGSGLSSTCSRSTVSLCSQTPQSFLTITSAADC